MAKTTIQIDVDTREKLNEFKFSGETFNDLLLRLYESACERQLQDLLLSSNDSEPVDDAIEWVKKNG